MPQPDQVLHHQTGRVLLLPMEGLPSCDWLREYSDAPRIVACDFYVDGAERGEAIEGGYRLGSVDNVDHHAPDPRMYRQVSSGNLAAEYVHAYGPAPDTADVVIHHCDCDSIVSAAIARDFVDPSPELAAAVVAADHTGRENRIADTLQPLNKLRDIDFSFETLRRLVSGERLPHRAGVELSKRRRDRALMAKLVHRKTFVDAGAGVYYGVLEKRLDGGFLPDLLPQAVVILAATQRRDGLWEMKLRLGLKPPPGLSLFALDIPRFDPNFGGRWNAGSNNRQKVGFPFTRLTPQQYAGELAHSLKSFFDRKA